MRWFHWLLIAFVASPFVAFIGWTLVTLFTLAGWWSVPVLAWIAAATYITAPTGRAGPHGVRKPAA